MQVGLESLPVSDTGDGVAHLQLGGRVVTAALGDADVVHVGDQVLACIRAEDVSIQLSRTDAISSQRNQLDATVRGLTTEGPLVRVDLDAGFPLAAYITRPAREDLDLAEGRAVVAVFKGQAVHLIHR